MRNNINRGKILSVELGDGNSTTEISDIHNAFVQFYTNLFGSPFANQYNGLDRIKSLVKTKVSLSQSAMLARPISDAEIKDVFWSLKSNKAPSPDGYSASFF